MLVLSRKTNESITIIDEETGERMKITVTETRGDKARLGIDASKRFRILRSELEVEDTEEPTKPAAVA